MAKDDPARGRPARAVPSAMATGFCLDMSVLRIEGCDVRRIRPPGGGQSTPAAAARRGSGGGGGTGVVALVPGRWRLLAVEQEPHVLGDVGRVVADPLQVLGHEQQ